MPATDQSIKFCVFDSEGLDFVEPLWLKQKVFHSQLNWPFADEMHCTRFETRKRELLQKSATGKLRVEIAYAEANSHAVGYCVCSVLADGRGEVDSIFVDEAYRGCGVGSEMFGRAIRWLDEAGATSKIVAVAYPNRRALELYERFGFSPRTILMQEVKSEVE